MNRAAPRDTPARRSRGSMLRSVIVTAVIIDVALGGLVLAILVWSPTLGRGAKRLLAIPVESSGPHGVEAGSTIIPGSRDFLFCALSRTPPQGQATCEVSRMPDGWHIVSDPPGAAGCAAMCLK